MGSDNRSPRGATESASVRWDKEGRAFDDYRDALKRGADAAELRMLYEALRKRVGQARRIC